MRLWQKVILIQLSRRKAFASVVLVSVAQSVRRPPVSVLLSQCQPSTSSPGMLPLTPSFSQRFFFFSFFFFYNDRLKLVCLKKFVSVLTLQYNTQYNFIAKCQYTARGMLFGAKYTHHTFTPIIKHLITTTANKNNKK